jgi:hypothetical protein
MTRRKLEILIGIVALLVAFGFLAMANNNPHGLFKIPVFSILWQIVKNAWEYFIGFLWLFGKMLWSAISYSWLSIVIFIGFVVLLILGYFYKNKR